MTELERLRQVKFRGHPARLVFNTQDFLDQMNVIVLDIFTMLSEDEFKTLTKEARSLIINQFLVGYIELLCKEGEK